MFIKVRQKSRHNPFYRDLMLKLDKFSTQTVEVGRVWLELPSPSHSSKPNTSSIRKPNSTRIIIPSTSRSTYIYIRFVILGKP